jgi:transcriptional regulator GlxA family with amidase domain
MARHAGWAPRTFARRFRAETGSTPHRWLIEHRLLEARRLLETTGTSIDQIASRTGLGTGTNLRLLRQRDTQLTPSTYRKTFGTTS